MANKTDVNPIYIDTEGDVIPAGTPVKISSIVIKASADNFVVELTDGNDNPIFPDQANYSGQRSSAWSPGFPSTVDGLKAKTLTNVDYLVIHTAIPI